MDERLGPRLCRRQRPAGPQGRRGRRRHRAPAGRAGHRAGQAGRGPGQPGQERVPVQDEPRATDPPQRHPRVRPAARARRPHLRAVRERPPHAARRPPPARADQRGARHLPHRVRQPVAVAGAGRPARGRQGHRRPDPPSGRRAPAHHPGPGPARPRPDGPGRPPAAQAGAAQPGLQRGQVQPPRRHHPGRLPGHAQRAGGGRRPGHRARAVGRQDGPAVQPLRPPGGRGDPGPGHRHGPGPVQGADGGHGRRPDRRERRGQGDHLHRRSWPASLGRVQGCRAAPETVRPSARGSGTAGSAPGPGPRRGWTGRRGAGRGAPGPARPGRPRGRTS